MKIIFFDIDGTLIGEGTHLMSESTKDAIRKARENGHVCIINTGRTKVLVGENVTNQVEFDGYMLGCGTMAIYHDEMLMHHTFPKELSQRIMDGLQKHGIDAALEGSRYVYCEEFSDMKTDTFRNFMKGMSRKYSAKWECAPGNFDKFYAYVDERERMDAFRAEFEEELTFIDREFGYYEILPKGYSKATAIRFLAEKLNVPLEDTVAIGDSNNDLPMLECAGTGIAMGNSSKAVLEMADYITTDVDKDGIWNALKWLGVLDA